MVPAAQCQDRDDRDRDTLWFMPLLKKKGVSKRTLKRRVEKVEPEGGALKTQIKLECSMPRKVAAVRAPAADNGKLQIDVQAAGPERHVIRFTILKNMELKILMKSFIEHMFENHTELAVKE